MSAAASCAIERNRNSATKKVDVISDVSSTRCMQPTAYLLTARDVFHVLPHPQTRLARAHNACMARVDGGTVYIH